MKFLSASQSRAARGLLNWSQPDLAERCGMHVQTISQFEQDIGSPTKRTLQKITETFEQNGIEFLEGDGVRKYRPYAQLYSGTEGFRKLMDDVYEQAKSVGGKIRLWNAKPSNWIKWLGQDWYEAHAKRMQDILPNISFHVTCKEGETNFIGGKHAEYRWVPEKIFNEQAIYCFGNRIAFLNFEKDSVNIYVLYNQEFTDSFCLLFDLVWDEITKIPSGKSYKPAHA